MKTNLHKDWWFLTINGVLAILFGALTLFDSEAVMISISMYFGLLVLIGGVLILFGAMDHKRKQKNYNLMLAEGIIMAVVGILIMIYPLQTLRLFLILIGIWAFLVGILKIYIAIAIGKELGYRVALIVGGLLFSVIGLTLLIDPAWAAGNMFKIFGVIFIVLGMMMVYFSFAIRNIKTDTK
jgi:uncharacterized membrane protein HdeD (DUF308 family)